ncbi:MAG TPA: four helix bundle protein [Saprospiraceae bacterium]|nr:four helix bundle protein [Saprospiraceae bacterium]
MNDRKDILKEKSFAFALRVVKLYQFLTLEKKEFVLSKQFLRSATSIGANIRESKNAESGMDFIHKLAIAQKECDESLYWIELLRASEFLTQKEFESVHADGSELLKIIKSSILTKKQNLKKKKAGS